MGFEITVLEGVDKGKVFTSTRVEVVVGKNPENDLVLSDPGISRQHFCIRDKGGACVIRDMGSSNGTILNGRPVKEEVLRAGDLITAGCVVLRFEGFGAAAGNTRRSNQDTDTNEPTGRRSKEDVVAPSDSKSMPDRPILFSKGLRRKQDPGKVGSGMDGGRPRPEALSTASTLAPHPSAFSRGGLWARGRIQRLTRPQRILFFSAVFLLLLLLLGIAFKGGKKLVQATLDHSSEVFEPGEVDTSGAYLTFGLGPVDVRCRSVASFRFRHAGGRATMTYQVAGVDNRQEVEVLVNGAHVAYAPITLNRWSEPLRLTFPRKQLLENEINQVSIVNVINTQDPNADELWAVTVWSIEEQPLPSPDRGKAEEALQNAKEQYKNKNVAPENLFQALQYFKRARDYLELLPEDSRGDIYSEANESVVKIEEELEKKYRDLSFSAEQARKFNRRKQLKNVFHQMLLTFPNPEDRRHQEAKQQLDELQ